jgi:N-methylhydantoinase A
MWAPEPSYRVGPPAEVHRREMRRVQQVLQELVATLDVLDQRLACDETERGDHGAARVADRRCHRAGEGLHVGDGNRIAGLTDPLQLPEQFVGIGQCSIGQLLQRPIVWTDSYGQLKVGPQSAGANPGPICYSKGGTKPTVTDAAVILGRLPAALVGGEIELDARAARRAFVALGEEVGLDPDELAAGALEVAAANQVFGIRQVTTVRGREPGDYAMVAFGGAGGLFATEVADFLGINTVISPPDPGNLCAFGLHVCDVTRDYIRTLVRRQSSADADEIIAAWRELERLGFADIEGEGIGRDAIAVHFIGDVRYFGEGHEVQVEIPRELSGRAALDFVWEEFHQVHDRTFGFNYRGQQDVELVNLRVRAVGRQDRPQLKAAEDARPPAAPFAGRKVYWRSTGWIDVPLFRRAELALDQHIGGPAIVEEYGATTVMPPSWSLHTDRYRDLILVSGR